LNDEYAKRWHYFYMFHSHFYDQTRWIYLFGRKSICKWLPSKPPGSIIEIGCGTGVNIETLSELYPESEIWGVDATMPMLDKARRKFKNNNEDGRIKLIHGMYCRDSLNFGSSGNGSLNAGVLFFSYTLTLMPNYEEAIEQAYNDLAPGGYLAVVDFMGTDHSLVYKWFQMHHVHMVDDLLMLLEKRFPDFRSRISTAFCGLWRYFIFVGRKPS